MSPAASQQHYSDLAQLLKQFREAASKTQEQLARELNQHDSLKQRRRTVNREAINRIEKGHASLRPFLADALDEYAKDNDLSSPGFSFLVKSQRIPETTRERGSQIDRILRSKNYSSLFFAVCDIFDFAHCLRSARPAPKLDITVILPTRNRVYELFGGAVRNGDSRPELFEGYADNLNQHIEDQVHLIYGVCSRSRDLQLEVFESDLVLNSVVLAKGDRETSCVYWPCAPFGSMQFEPNLVPVVDDAGVSAWYEAQILGAVRHASAKNRLYLGDTYVRSEDEPPSDDSKYVPVLRPKFSNFYPPKASGDDTELDREGAAVAMMMPYVVGVNRGKRDIQILLQWRSPVSIDEEIGPSGQLAFVATRVYSSIALKAISGIDCDGRQPDTYRRLRLEYLEDQSQYALDSIQEEVVRTESQSNSGQESIIEQVYRDAVGEHLRLTYGINCYADTSEDRIESTDFKNLRVSKPYGANIVPRLFFVKLNPGERDTMIRSAGRYADTEVRLFRIDELLEAIEASDVPGESRPHDDFLALAIGDKKVSKAFARALVALKDRWVTP